jgi:hypothetical protein
LVGWLVGTSSCGTQWPTHSGGENQRRLVNDRRDHCIGSDLSLVITIIDMYHGHDHTQQNTSSLDHHSCIAHIRLSSCQSVELHNATLTSISISIIDTHTNDASR